MTQEALPESVQAAPPSPEEYKHEFVVNFKMAMDPPATRIYVVKVKGGYLRFQHTGNKAFGVANRRMATRFDSPIWAATIATFAEGSKVVRLTTKAERELEKMHETGGSIWTYRKDKDKGEPEMVAPPERQGTPTGGASDG